MHIPAIGRTTLTLAIALLAIGLSTSAAAPPKLPKGPVPTAAGHRHCGPRWLFGHRFTVEGQGIRCREARKVVSRSCLINLKKRWSCFSYRESKPFVVWFPTEDLFKRVQYPAVLLRRYPCSQSEVTPGLFAVSTRVFPTRRFPTRRQLLADDVLRCKLLLLGDELSKVEALLGPPDETVMEASSKQSLVYNLGPERDSVFQIDPEFLLVEISGGLATSISIEQGG